MKPFALVLWASSAAAQGPVIVVDDHAGPGVDSTSLQAAVDSAPEGATILVKPGQYFQGFEVSGKSLAIVGEAGSPPQFGKTGAISGLGADQTVVLRGILIQADIAALQIDDNAGRVWIEDVQAFATPGGYIGPSTGISIVNSASVALLRVTCSGGIPGGSPFYESGGLICVDSTVSLVESVVTGEQGPDLACVWCGLIGADGSEGAVIDGSFLFASGSVIRGGAGASILDPCCTAPCFAIAGAGGPGLVMQGANPEVWLLDTSLVGGPAGTTVGCGTSADGPGPAAS